MNTLRNFAKSAFAHIFAKFKYFAKQFILTDIDDRFCNAMSFSVEIRLRNLQQFRSFT